MSCFPPPSGKTRVPERIELGNAKLKTSVGRELLVQPDTRALDGFQIMLSGSACLNSRGPGLQSQAFAVLAL